MPKTPTSPCQHSHLHPGPIRPSCMLCSRCTLIENTLSTNSPGKAAAAGPVLPTACPDDIGPLRLATSVRQEKSTHPQHAQDFSTQSPKATQQQGMRKPAAQHAAKHPGPCLRRRAQFTVRGGGLTGIKAVNVVLRVQRVFASAL